MKEGNSNRDYGQPNRDQTDYLKSREVYLKKKKRKDIIVKYRKRKEPCRKVYEVVKESHVSDEVNRG